MFLAFASSVLLPHTAPRRRATCTVRPRQAPRAAEESWDKAGEWEKNAKIPAKGIQEVEFIIKQDGSVEERVTGIRGKNCINVRGHATALYHRFVAFFDVANKTYCLSFAVRIFRTPILS